mmetsp:Transcript_65649/g.184853  ORF Transcript_65649/g.184853 Transcript_65649/m.184853 type:complete len:104 (+) Transcript_65649:1-312(+)
MLVVGRPVRTPVMAPPMQMGMAVYQPPMQLTAQTEVPKGLAAGDSFVVQTPDSQTVSVTVPEGVEPGSTITYAYPAHAALPTRVGQSLQGHPFQDGANDLFRA